MSSQSTGAESIFLEALGKPSPGERAAYLDEACTGDPRLRRRVEALLTAHEHAGDFLVVPWFESGPARPEQRPGGVENLAAEVTQPDLTAHPAPGPDDPPSFHFLGPPRHPGQLGTLGLYDITEVIGRGGMGVVLKGFDPQLHRSVAVKVLTPEAASNPMARWRFLREAQAAAAISHDHVVTIHAVHESDRLPYLVMEYIKGTSLQDLIHRKGGMELREILRIGMQIASGLAAAHAQGLVHRDIKPANILLENGVQRVKITDFGLARAVDDVGMTQTGMVSGTPLYMAPEQARGELVDHRADLFSLGSALYAMCTGRSPFRAETMMGVLRRVCEDTPRPIHEVNPEIPDWLCAIVERLLEKNPEDRFQTAAEVAGRLEVGLAHVQQPDVVPRPRVRRLRKHSRSGLRALAGLARGVGNLALGIVTLCILTAVVTLVRGSFFGSSDRRATLLVDVTDPQITAIRIEPRDELAREHFGPAAALDFRLNGNRQLRLADSLAPGLYQVSFRREGPALYEDQAVRILADETHRVSVPLARPRSTVATPTAPGRLPDRTPPSQPAREIALARRFLRGEHAGGAFGIHSVAVTPDGKRALTGHHGGPACLWDLEAGTELRSFGGHEDTVRTVAISPDGRLGLSGSEDGTIRLWDLEAGAEVRRFTGHSGRVQSVAFSPAGDVFVSGSADFEGDEDNSVRLWSTATGRELRRLPGRIGFIQHVAFSPDGELVAASDGKFGQILLWRPSTGDVVHRFGGSPSHAKGLAFTPDGRYLIAGFIAVSQRDDVWDDPANCVLRLWDLKSGRLVREFVGHRASVVAVAVSPDGRYLLSAGAGWHDAEGRFVPAAEQTVRLWDLASGRELCRYLANERLHSLAFTPDGRTFLSGGDESLRQWDVPQGLDAASDSAPRPITEGKSQAGWPSPGVHLRRWDRPPGDRDRPGGPDLAARPRRGDRALPPRPLRRLAFTTS